MIRLIICWKIRKYTRVYTIILLYYTSSTRLRWVLDFDTTHSVVLWNIQDGCFIYTKSIEISKRRDDRHDLSLRNNIYINILIIWTSKQVSCIALLVLALAPAGNLSGWEKWNQTPKSTLKKVIKECSTLYFNSIGGWPVLLPPGSHGYLHIVYASLPLVGYSWLLQYFSLLNPVYNAILANRRRWGAFTN